MNTMATYKELLKQQETLTLQIEEARKQEIADAVNRVRTLVAEYGLTPQDVFSSRKATKTRSGGKVAPKYRDPATGSTWTGRGKAPKWIEGQDRGKFVIG
jgi:DNA-binding protein H-NS